MYETSIERASRFSFFGFNRIMFPWNLSVVPVKLLLGHPLLWCKMKSECACQVLRIEETRNAYKILVENVKGKLKGCSPMWECNIT